MPKKRKEATRLGFFINGKPSSLLEILEASGNEEAWKSYLEAAHDSTSRQRYLEKYLGRDSLTTREIRHLTGIKGSTLCKWRESGKVHAKKISSRWFYSVEDLIQAIKTSDG